MTEIGILSTISTEVYTPNSNLTISGYNSVQGSISTDSSTGFGAQSFYNSSNNALVISYAGTDPTNVTGDLVADYDLFAGNTPEQATQALSYANQQIAAFQAQGNSNFNVVYTGHSLGGALAQFVHLSNGNGSAVVFNSPGVNNSFPSNNSSDILYVFSNPSEWGAASPIHNLGDIVGSNILYVLEAEGHSIVSLSNAINAENTTVVTTEQLREIVIEQLENASDTGDITTIIDNWAQSDLLNDVLLPALDATGNNCFLAGTMIDMWPEGVKANANGLYDEKEVLAKVWKKPIEQITADDWVLSYDKDGNLKPGKVTRTFQNQAKHILDVHGLMMTPGHATFCAEGKFKGQHVPIIDILRSDGCIQRSDGTIIRAATNCPINSSGDKFIWAVTGETKDGVTKVAQKGKIRLGTRYITPEGNDVSVLDMIMAHDVVITEEGLIKHNANDPSGMPFRWSFGDKLPKPEDYIMQRSQLTTQDIYQHGEWERAFPPQMPAPFAGEAGGSYKHDPVLQASASPNIPLSMQTRGDEGLSQNGTITSPNQPTMSRKQRRAMEAKKRKTKKQGNVTVH